MPLGCYSFCGGAEGPPSCCLPFPRCHPGGRRVCASAGVCLCVGAGLQRFHSGVRRAKFVCVVPLGETIANSRKWIGMEGLARDSGVKMKEFFHTQRNSLSFPPPLFLLQDALFISATWASVTHVHMQMQAWDMHKRTPPHSHPHKPMDKPKKYHYIFM